MERSSKHGPRIDEGIFSDEEAAARSEIARFISPSVFPATSAEIRESAQSNNAPTAVVEALERLSEGQTLENFEAVWEALRGEGRETVLSALSFHRSTERTKG